MIEYRGFRFYVDGEPVNQKHDGLTLLDVCERLMLCPISVAYERSVLGSRYHTWLSNDNRILVSEEGNGVVMNDHVVLHSFELISGFRYVKTKIISAFGFSKSLAYRLEMEFRNDDKHEITLSEFHLHSDKKIFHGFTNKMMLGYSVFMPEFASARLANIDKLINEIGLEEIVKANIALEALC